MKFALVCAVLAVSMVAVLGQTVNHPPTMIPASSMRGYSVVANQTEYKLVHPYSDSDGQWYSKHVAASVSSGVVAYTIQPYSSIWGLSSSQQYILNVPAGLETATWAAADMEAKTLGSAGWYSLLGGATQPAWEYVYAIAWNTAGDTLYVAAELSSSSTGGFWKYAASTWTQVGVMTTTDGSISQVYAIAIDPTSQNVFFIGTDTSTGYYDLYVLATGGTATTQPTAISQYADTINPSGVGLGVDSVGNVYFVSESNARIFKITAPISHTSYVAATELTWTYWYYQYGSSVTGPSISGLAVDGWDRLIISAATANGYTSDTVSSVYAIWPGSDRSYSGMFVPLVDGLYQPGPATRVGSAATTGNAGVWYFIDYYNPGSETYGSSYLAASAPFVNITINGVAGAGFQPQPASTNTILNVIPTTGANTLSVSPSIVLTSTLTVTVMDASQCGTSGAYVACGSFPAGATWTTFSFAIGDGPQNPKTVVYTLGASTPLGTAIQFNYTTTLGSWFPSPAFSYPFDYTAKLSATTTTTAGSAIVAGGTLTATVTITPALTGTDTVEVEAYDLSYSGTITTTGSSSYCTLSASVTSCVFTYTAYAASSGPALGTPIMLSFTDYYSSSGDFPTTSGATLGPFYYGSVPTPGGGTGGGGSTTGGAGGQTGSHPAAGSSSGSGGTTGGTSGQASPASVLSVNFIALFAAAAAGILAAIRA